MPKAFDYLSYRTFLRDWFDAKKQANPRYSHRVFARRAGVASPSFLKDLWDGRRHLSEATLDGLLKALALPSDETEFFVDLVRAEHADRLDDRTAALQRIGASQRFRAARPIEAATLSYLSDWVIPATRELAFRSDFMDDPHWIAEQLEPQVEPQRAARALEVLTGLGLLTREGGGPPRPAEATLATPHEAPRAAMAYHEQMLTLAQRALLSVRAEERHVVGATVAIPERLVPELKAEIDRFQERILHLCDGSLGTATRVYQLQVHLFPLSRRRRGVS